MKKVLSLVLVMAMILSSFSFAFAAPKFEDVVDADYEEAVNTLVALGVVTGYEDGTYRPERVVTRAEMAKLIVEILGYGDLVAGSKSNFTDTQGHWADAWIALAAGKGLVVGTGDGKFTPDRTVSYDEAITMVVRGIGYTDDCNELKNMTWPTNFKVKAAELGITKNVKLAADGADRGGVAQILFNALSATLVTVDVDGNVKYIVDKNDAGKELLSRIATLDEEFKVTTSVVDPKNKNFAGELVDLAPYMFQELKVYLNDDDQVVYIKGTNSLVLEGKVDEVTTTATLNTLAVKDGNGKIQKVTFNTTGSAYIVIDNSDIFENGALRESDKTLKSLEDTETIKVVANDSNGNGKIESSEVVGFVTIEQTKVGRIEKEYVAGKDKIDGFILPTDDDKADLDNITVTGDATKLEDIEVDDVVVQYLSEDETVTKLVVTRDTVEGKITRVDGTKKFYIDGVLHNLNTTAGHVTGLELGDEGIFFLDQNGKIVDYDGEAAGPVNYAVVVNKADGETDYRFGKSIKTYPQLKLATQDDETLIFDIQVKMDSTGKVSGSAKVGTAPIIADNTTGDLTIANVNVGDLIKYNVNKDGRISKVTNEASSLNSSSSGVYVNEIDLDKSTNKLASNAVIFDATDNDFAVVSENALPSKLYAYVLRDNNGLIKVLVAKHGQIDALADTSFAYITKTNPAYNADGDEVQTIDIYTDGQKKTIQTTTDVQALTEKKVYKVKYDGSDVKSATLEGFGSTVTATAINAKGGMIKLNDGNWYALSDHATILELKSDDSVKGIRDLYDIEVNANIYVFKTKGDIDLILFK